MRNEESSATRRLIDQFKRASEEAEDRLRLQEYQQAMALFFEASQAADEMCERFITLLIRTAPSPSHRILLVEVLSWRLRYYTSQYDYHLSVAQTLRGLPREEWIARLETILVLSQSLVTKLIPILKQADDAGLRKRIQKVLDDWVSGIRNLVEKLKTWGMASSQASRVLEWALDNDLENLVRAV
ncbi:MAG: hypothetical protein BAJATHORv1_10350 [Candidatus Thorarchaeota archaeon]|nr:MAG: hypothetical protein BAJATHORv1_10350 [Candidatus Thorarchaeota archaeon]